MKTHHPRHLAKETAIISATFVFFTRAYRIRCCDAVLYNYSYSTNTNSGDLSMICFESLSGMISLLVFGFVCAL